MGMNAWICDYTYFTKHQTYFCPLHKKMKHEPLLWWDVKYNRQPKWNAMRTLSTEWKCAFCWHSNFTAHRMLLKCFQSFFFFEDSLIIKGISILKSKMCSYAVSLENTKMIVITSRNLENNTVFQWLYLLSALCI